MADEILINKRIDQLPKNAVLKGHYVFPIRNLDNNTTEQVPLSEILAGTTSGNFEWVTDNDPGYAELVVVTHNGKWYQSLIPDNLNNVPGMDEDIWLEVNKSPSGIAFWQAGVYVQDTVVVLYDDGSGPKIYILNDGTRPFISSDFPTELTANQWAGISFSLSANNGVVLESGTLKLGGTTSQDRTIDIGDGRYLLWRSVGSLTSTEFYMQKTGTEHGLYIIQGNNADGFVAIAVDPGAQAGGPAGIKLYEARGVGARVGMTYYGFGGDYSDLIAESLVPKEFVESLISASASNLAIDDTYADIAELLADQGNQELGAWYLVEDASADLTVDYDWAIYQKKVASTANISDYFKIAEKESLDLVVTNAAEGTKGIVEEASNAEVTAGTAVGGTGAKLFITPAKLATFITAFIGAVHTWALKQTFTTAPRFSSANASEFLKTDGSKDLVSVSPAIQSDMLTGTDNTKPMTAASLQSVRSLVRLACSISAGTMTIDVGLKREVKFENTTTISANFILALANESNLEEMSGIIFVTGTVVMTCPSSIVMEEDNSRWNNGTKALTMIGGTASPFVLSFSRISSTKIEMRASFKIHTS